MQSQNRFHFHILFSENMRSERGGENFPNSKAKKIQIAPLQCGIFYFYFRSLHFFSGSVYRDSLHIRAPPACVLRVLSSFTNGARNIKNIQLSNINVVLGFSDFELCVVAFDSIVFI
jgi:hypothetical protein